MSRTKTPTGPRAYAYGQRLENESIRVAMEGDSAYARFGAQTNIGDLGWLAVLAEEFGEVAMHVTKTAVPPYTNPELSRADLVAELRQVGAVALRWAVAIELGMPIAAWEQSTLLTEPATF